MNWLEVRKTYPSQIVLIEALETNTANKIREVLNMSVISTHEDSSAACKAYNMLHTKYPYREFYIFQTAREKIDVIDASEGREWKTRINKFLADSVTSVNTDINEQLKSDNEMKTHEEVWRDIYTMSNGERIKLLEKLFYRYFDNRPPEEVIKREEIKEIWGEED